MNEKFIPSEFVLFRRVPILVKKLPYITIPPKKRDPTIVMEQITNILIVTNVREDSEKVFYQLDNGGYYFLSRVEEPYQAALFKKQHCILYFLYKFFQERKEHG